jgi:hypothetical protein
LNVLLERDLILLVDVDLVKGDVRVELCELFYFGCDHSARTAPLGGVVNDDRLF